MNSSYHDPAHDYKVYAPLYTSLRCENSENSQLWDDLFEQVCEKSDSGTKKFSEILLNTPDSRLKCGCIYNNCLGSVIYTANVEIFEVLCRRGLDFDMCIHKESYGMVLHPHKYTVLHKLAQYGRSRVFDFLTIAKRFGANINLQDPKGKTVLHYASCNYNHGNALPFARHGARHDIADENGLVPIQRVLETLKKL